MNYRNDVEIISRSSLSVHMPGKRTRKENNSRKWFRKIRIEEIIHNRKQNIKASINKWKINNK